MYLKESLNYCVCIVLMKLVIYVKSISEDVANIWAYQSNSCSCLSTVCAVQKQYIALQNIGKCTYIDINITHFYE